MECLCALRGVHCCQPGFPVAQGLSRYRCFLPDLTGFTVPPCTGPNYQQSISSRAQCPVGGEGGIRTLGTGLTAHTISSRAPSTARSPLQRDKSTLSLCPARPTDH